MNKFIPINKKSKKAQKEYYAKKRNTWGELNPMTRTMPNGKGYNRKKMKQEDRRNGRLSRGDMICNIFSLWMVCKQAFQTSLKFKKELSEYGYRVGKISMKAETVAFEKVEE